MGDCQSKSKPIQTDNVNNLRKNGIASTMATSKPASSDPVEHQSQKISLFQPQQNKP